MWLKPANLGRWLGAVRVQRGAVIVGAGGATGIPLPARIADLGAGIYVSDRLSPQSS
ncbi:hypothetical protein LAUMK13_03514 [Mycobacterium innocens]|uniref:Uncharacterized protein n=1 Tax=Mycobacterium innocens TaxID=2341083 RepID=A0A498Q8N9_9MYCO|nr:hypothetical protein LAUMK13_03514 [Mycobacterium innocens]